MRNDPVRDAVVLENISKWAGSGRGRTDIVKGVNLAIPAGAFTAIMGASGCGKSTLMNLMGLLDTPSAGRRTVLGESIETLDDDHQAHLRARRIGFIFQAFHLLPYLTAVQNVALSLHYAHRDRADERSRELLKTMGLGHRLHHYPTVLSGGERQRVAIARALANDPALILADEPTGALDSASGEQVMGILNELNRKGATVVIVTHDAQVARHARRVLHMKDGRFS